MYSRETFNINLLAAHYDTNHAHRTQNIKGCDAHACWKQNKTINYGNKTVYTQLRIFKLRLCAIIDHFAISMGDP